MVLVSLARPKEGQNCSVPAAITSKHFSSTSLESVPVCHYEKFSNFMPHQGGDCVAWPWRESQRDIPLEDGELVVMGDNSSQQQRKPSKQEISFFFFFKFMRQEY
jgi:hypothetical protein